jgi:hypothetical protein
MAQERCWPTIVDREGVRVNTSKAKICQICGAKVEGFKKCEAHFNSEHPSDLVYVVCSSLFYFINNLITKERHGKCFGGKEEESGRRCTKVGLINCN